MVFSNRGTPPEQKSQTEVLEAVRSTFKLPDFRRLVFADFSYFTGLTIAQTASEIDTSDTDTHGLTREGMDTEFDDSDIEPASRPAGSSRS